MMSWVEPAEESFGQKCYPCLRYKVLPMSPVSTRNEVARLEGFEPPTPGFEAQCSIQLSYRRQRMPILALSR